MVRNRNKMALYEVINRANAQPAEPKGSDKDKAGEAKKAAKRPAKAKRPTKSVWSGRPRMLSLLQGRVEISIPYQLAVAILLGVLLVVLVAFRLGQFSGKKIAAAGMGVDLSPVTAVDSSPATPAIDEALRDAEVPAGIITAPSGSNHIVIQEFGKRRDLVPVMNYFSDNGIECLIIEHSGKYFLVTKNRYNRTEGNKALEKIKETGAGYKAPTGFESFAPRLFSDAYLKKF